MGEKSWPPHRQGARSAGWPLTCRACPPVPATGCTAPFGRCRAPPAIDRRGGGIPGSARGAPAPQRGRCRCSRPRLLRRCRGRRCSPAAARIPGGARYSGRGPRMGTQGSGGADMMRAITRHPKVGTEAHAGDRAHATTLVACGRWVRGPCSRNSQHPGRLQTPEPDHWMRRASRFKIASRTVASEASPGSGRTARLRACHVRDPSTTS